MQLQVSELMGMLLANRSCYNVQMPQMFEQSCILVELSAARHSLLRTPLLPQQLQPVITRHLQLVKVEDFDSGYSTQGLWQGTTLAAPDADHPVPTAAAAAAAVDAISGSDSPSHL
jgi:hypothetical protein